ncbi:Macrophage mannose receptor 1 [Dissostichus eleginoides]|uniref:Macrophage mannose receptor 1 n=1 Tax=Dissostichus eleginoides TaxID=100907 RepID=A0AAD9F1L6_DISEL|nr:Macrophage mannose receptor 1 [Dissostichus eleginoides]
MERTILLLFFVQLSQSGVDRLRKAAGESNPQGWIGLHRDLNNLTGWKWSGGGHMTYQNWGRGQPDNHRNIETSVHVFNENREWNDAAETKKKDFYCINITVVEVKKTWEKALEHCRENQSNLTSLLDETEHLLAWKEALKVQSERVWIGLRYLGDRWLWVNGDPLQAAVGELGLQEKLNFICI